MHERCNAMLATLGSMQSLMNNIGCRVECEAVLTSVSEEPIIVVCFKETQHHCQNRQHQHDAKSDVDKVRQSFLQGECHHSNPRLNVPVNASIKPSVLHLTNQSINQMHKEGMATMPVRSLVKVLLMSHT